MAANGLAISPDEQTVVFVDGAPPFGLFRRDLGRLEAVPIPGAENARMPFFSPDAEWVGYFDAAENTLKRVRLDGSEVQTLGPVPPAARSAGWAEDGTIVLYSSGFNGVLRVRETGGEIAPIESTAGLPLRWLDLLPGGEVVLGSITHSGERQVVVVPLETGEPKILFPGATPRYVTTGHIVYWRQGALWVVPFDAERLEVAGRPTLILQGVGAGTNGLAHFAVSESLLVYRAGGLLGTSSGFPVWVDRQGNEEPLGIDPGLYAWPRISPDGTKVALVRLQGNDDIWIYDLTSGVFSQLTFNPAADGSPIWTPDGERVVFRSSRDGPFNLYSRRADGSDEAERLTTNSANQRAYGWTQDGSTLLFGQLDRGTESDLWSVSIEPGSTPVPLMREVFTETHPAISPDGRWIAYLSYELGYAEIFVHSFPDLGGKWLISTVDIGLDASVANADPREGRSPVWSPDGKELFYMSGPALLSVPVSTEGTFTPEAPEVLFEGFWITSPGPQYDVSPDGQRFLMIKWGDAETSATANELIVVENWFEDLSQRMGN
jgi:serine/threonine-protein kinase